LKRKNFIHVLDLFSGCGGLSLGLKMSSSRFNLVGAIDFYNEAIKIFQHNIKSEKALILSEDIKKLPPEHFREMLVEHNLPKPDIIIGGPPCPGFSSIGKSKILSLVKEGKWDLKEVLHSYIDDPRNGLFKEFIKYVKELKPKLILFENVKGMGSHMIRVPEGEIKTVELIKLNLKNIGYNVKDKILNAADFGVPQIRERVFIVGVREDYPIDEFRFPDATHFSREDRMKEKDLDIKEKKPHVTASQAILDLKSFKNHVKQNHYGIEFDYKFSVQEAVKWFKDVYSKADEEYFANDDYLEMEEFLLSMRQAYDVLRNYTNKITCHSPRIVHQSEDKEIFNMLYTERYGRLVYQNLPERLKRYSSASFGDKMRRIPWWKPSWTIIAHLSVDGYMFIHPERHSISEEVSGQDRSISVREAARLQSFPDSFDFGVEGSISRGHQFRVIGNAVPPLLAKALGKSILDFLEMNGL
jgi:DNA (cytosine-5)-methyltransferase 1